MENTKRAQKEKSRIRPSGETYVEPKDLLSGFERVREAGRRESRAKGEVVIVRYADDFVIGFQYREDAQRLQKELEERMQQFGLEMNSEKTRLIEFGRFAIDNRAKRGDGKPLIHHQKK
jgi:hypothetical protein